MIRKGRRHSGTAIGAVLGIVVLMGLTAEGDAQFSTGCVGDCNADGGVTVAECISLVGIALGSQDLPACPHGVPDGAGVDISLIIRSVLMAVRGCPVLGSGDCCQCEGFCAAPIDGTCGGCSASFGVPCVGGTSCGPTATPSPPATAVASPTPTTTPATTDCCQCSTSCRAPIDGSCGDCSIVREAACGSGMLCVRTSEHQKR